VSAPPYVIRRAVQSDVPTMVGLRREAEQWLVKHRIEQWTTKWVEIGTEKIQRATRQRRAWVIEIGGAVGATVTLGGPDEDLWHIEDGPALYLYKLIVARRHAGLGIGAAVLDWATDRASRLGYPWLRLDVWPSNPVLMDYYRRHRFEYVRTEHVPERDTGALFQRKAISTESPQFIDADR
jgi:ribosomal protein S18 acetylase RimI-like enzyme